MDTMIDTLTMNGQTITLDYDPVDKPAHYNLNGGIRMYRLHQRSSRIKAGFVAYCRGNVMKYNHRACIRMLRL